MITPQYLADLVAWGAIGARTTESQCIVKWLRAVLPGRLQERHRRQWKIAVDAVQAAGHPHHFLAVTKDGRTAIAATAGNGDCHVILRGGSQPTTMPLVSRRQRGAGEGRPAPAPDDGRQPCQQQQSRKTSRR